MPRSKHDENAQREPPRATYVSDSLPVMPPIPACCPRCASLLITAYNETHCYACGWVLSPQPIDYREPFERRTKCHNCQNKPAPEKTYCQSCLDYMKNYKRGKVGA